MDSHDEKMVPDDQDLKTKYREVIEKMVLARSEQEKINIKALLSSATSENLSKRPKSTNVSFSFKKTVNFIIQTQILERRFLLNKLKIFYFILGVLEELS